MDDGSPGRWSARLVRAAVGLLLAAFAGTGLCAPAAAADETLTWGVKPADNDHGTGRANFGYELDPGEVVRDALVVTNRSTSELALQVYAADAFTTPSGQLDLLSADEPSSDLGTWVRLDVTEVTLAPGESSEVGFTLTVPPDARPGDHSGGVVTSFMTQAQGTTLTYDRRLGSRMHVRVSGELASAATVSDVDVVYHDTWNPFASSTATVRYTVTNTGNTRVAASGSVSMSGPFGWARATAADDELPELLPGETHVREVVVGGVWPLVRAQAHVGLAATGVGLGGEPIGVAGVSASAWAVPWAWLVAIALVVAVAAWLPALLDRRRRRGPSPDEAAAVAVDGPVADGPASGR